MDVQRKYKNWLQDKNCNTAAPHHHPPLMLILRSEPENPGLSFGTCCL
jgi:hypothetical protein